jgi:hypothetical protein
MRMRNDPPENAIDVWTAFGLWSESWKAAKPERWMPPLALRSQSYSVMTTVGEEIRRGKTPWVDTKTLGSRSYISAVDHADVLRPLKDLSDMGERGQLEWWARPSAVDGNYYVSMPAAELRLYLMPFTEGAEDVLEHRHTFDWVWAPRYRLRLDAAAVKLARAAVHKHFYAAMKASPDHNPKSVDDWVADPEIVALHRGGLLPTAIRDEYAAAMDAAGVKESWGRPGRKSRRKLPPQNSEN